ncbi:benzoylformate decarboxylase [Actinoplanes sp. NPDC051851]|uniref:benzoylformate decarboxylase n=1 Tax=Actinoplanes sp. NPDC051851 TaxID=3154753 RepID=UPI00343EF846
MGDVRSTFLDVCRRAGLTTWFGNPGSTELRMFRDWPADVDYVLALQEASAAGMAAGWSIATGGPALVSLHSAGGVGHALGAIFNAYRDRIPLVVIAGQQTRAMLPTRPFLGADEPALFPRPYVKWSHQPERAAAVPGALAEACRVATTPPRGPVFLSIPEDDWDQEADPVPVRTVHGGFGPEPDALREVAGALREARRPAIVSGPGVDEDGAWAETVALAETLGAAVWAAPMASRAAFPEDHPLFRGHLSPVRTSIAEVLGRYDVVLVLGAPVFTCHVHTEGAFVPDRTRLFHLDCDPAATAWAAAGTSLLSTIRVGARALLDEIGPGGGRLLSAAGGPDGVPDEKATKREAPHLNDPLAAAGVLSALGAAMPDGAVLVEEAPSHKDTLHEVIPITRPRGFVTTGSGALGWGIPVAVGRALAGERVICVTGDGSSLYSIQALWTAAQRDASLTVLILNNQRYEAVSGLARRIGIHSTPGTTLPGIDFPAIAQGFGCSSARVTTAAAFPEALDRALRHPGPYVLDVAVTATDRPLYERLRHRP